MIYKRLFNYNFLYLYGIPNRTSSLIHSANVQIMLQPCYVINSTMVILVYSQLNSLKCANNEEMRRSDDLGKHQ